jgi:DedD protein
MNPENKQRIIGVVVLVAFVALLIPFLFSSGTKNEANSENVPVAINNEEAVPGSNAGQGPQETISSPQTSVSDILMQSKEELISPENKNNSVTEKVPSVGQEEPIPSQQPVPAKFETSPTPKVVSEKDILKTIPVAKQKHKKETKIKPVNKKVATASNVKGFWSVQIGSFSNQDRVQSLVSKLKASHFRVFMQKVTTSHGPMVRVLVGRETNRADAEKISHRLQKLMKLNGRIVNNK